MDLTNEELVFLKRQGLGPSDVFDTRGMSSAKWKQKIKLEGKTVALGTPCAEAGHRLRTRAGHCVQCDTKKLAYQKRHRSFACLYIAGSKAQQLIKVGTAKSTEERRRKLNFEAYAGVSDWVVLFSIKIADAGKIEMQTHGELRAFASPRGFIKDGKPQDTREAFTCSFTRAYDVLQGIAPRGLLLDSFALAAISLAYPIAST
jgi:hypothetical protein